jgi:uncharacterized protein YjlB
MSHLHATLPTTLRFVDDGRIPNHPDYPVLLYRGVLDQTDDLAAAFEVLFDANHWPPAWRDTVYPYHHYHAGAHEAFGIVSGQARLQLGGEQGEVVDIAAGDALVLPAGTGHCRLSASADFLAVGAYPRGSVIDMQRLAGGESSALRAAIRAVARPVADPVGGAHGALMTLWPPLQAS